MTICALVHCQREPHRCERERIVSGSYHKLITKMYKINNNIRVRTGGSVHQKPQTYEHTSIINALVLVIVAITAQSAHLMSVHCTMLTHPYTAHNVQITLRKCNSRSQQHVYNRCSTTMNTAVLSLFAIIFFTLKRYKVRRSLAFSHIHLMTFPPRICSYDF